MTAGHAADAPLPPRINFVATLVRQLHLGMMADDVIRAMGKAAKETDFAMGSKVDCPQADFCNTIAPKSRRPPPEPNISDARRGAGLQA